MKRFSGPEEIIRSRQRAIGARPSARKTKLARLRDGLIGSSIPQHNSHQLKRAIQRAIG